MMRGRSRPALRRVPWRSTPIAELGRAPHTKDGARLIREARVFITATLDQRVPWYARLSATAMPAAYYLAPIDPIPNRVPVVGHFDDAIVALLAIALFVRLVPLSLRDQLRADLQEPTAENGVAALQRERVIKAAVTVLCLTVLGAITGDLERAPGAWRDLAILEVGG